MLLAIFGGVELLFLWFVAAAAVTSVASASLIQIGPWAHEAGALARVIIFFGLSLRTP
jgi:hypothetical protein